MFLLRSLRIHRCHLYIRAGHDRQADPTFFSFSLLALALHASGMSVAKSFKLNTGAEIPAIGLGEDGVTST